MLKKWGFLGVAMLLAAPAWAQDAMDGMGRMDAMDGMERSELQADTSRDGVFGAPMVLSPQVGVFSFADRGGQYQSRASVGAILDWDAGDLVGDRLFGLSMGLQTGLQYSHIGASNSGFFGARDTGSASGGSNVFLIPLAATVGWDPMDKVNLTAHFGATMLYQSSNGSVQTGRAEAGDSGAQFFPAAGLNVGWAPNRIVGLSLRGEIIPTPADDMFTASLGAAFPLGG